MAHPSDVFLSKRNIWKGEPMFSEWILPNNWKTMATALANVLHRRSAWRLHVIMIGIIFAKGRKTITSWFRAAGIVRQYKAFYYFTGAFHLNLWVHSMVELWGWQQRVNVIRDRRDSPWDDATRRPSHADRCAALRRETLKETFFETFGHNRKNRKIVRQFYKLMKLAA